MPDFFGVYLEASIDTYGDEFGSGVQHFDLWTNSQSVDVSPMVSKVPVGAAADNQAAAEATSIALRNQNITPSMKKNLQANLSALNDISWVQELQVEMGLARNCRISITLNPPYEQGLELVNSPLLRYGVGQLNVRVGYTTGDREMSEYFIGMLQWPDVRLGSDITITLNALGVGYVLQASDAIEYMDFDTAPSKAQVIEKILEKTKQNIDDLWADFDIKKASEAVGKKDLENFPIFKAAEAIPATDNKGNKVDNKVRVCVGSRNYWWYISNTVQGSGLDIFITDKKIKIKRRDKWMSPSDEKNLKTFMLRGGLDPSRDIYPILEMNSPTQAVWLMPGAGELVVKQSDIASDKSGVNNHDVNNKTDPKNSASTQAADSKKGKKPITAGSKNLRVPGNPEYSDARDQAIGIFRNINYQMGTQLSVETVGIPSLMPGQTIAVGGSGAASVQSLYATNAKTGVYDGVYGVLNVIHNIGVAGFSTKFDAIGNLQPIPLRTEAPSSAPISDIITKSSTVVV